MRKISLLLIFLFACSYARTPEKPKEESQMDSRREFFSKLYSHSVRIDRHCMEKVIKAAGSGVIIKKFNNPEYKSNHILVVTAYHVVDNEDCFYYGRQENGDKFRLEIVDYDKEGDIALLAGWSSTARKGALLELDPFPGQKAYCVGWPTQPRWVTDSPRISVTSGEVATVGLKDSQIRVSAPIYHGSSGGACYSVEGKVLGISRQYVGVFGVPIPGYYYSVSGDRIQKLLNHNQF